MWIIDGAARKSGSLGYAALDVLYHRICGRFVWENGVLTVYFCSIGEALNRIGRRAIMCIMPIAALALIWHVLAWKAASRAVPHNLYAPSRRTLPRLAEIAG